MRDLSLTNCLLEGFSRGVAVEDQVIALESLLNYSLNTSKGFINIPVYHLKANNKAYGDASGNDGGFYVIKDIKVKESMRDLSGNSTRVNVDVSFTQVPQYQVDSGRDQASQAVTGSKAAFPEQQADQGLKETKSAKDKKVAKATKSTSGPNSAPPVPPVKTPEPVKPGSLYDASRWTTPITGGSLYNAGRWVPLDQKLFP
jgi:hypothetical protein